MSAGTNRPWDEMLQGVRMRPAMYVGNTERRGVRTLLGQVMDASVEATVLGRAAWVGVVVHRDGSLSVSDDGPGCVAGTEPCSQEEVLQLFTSAPTPPPPRLANPEARPDLWVVNGLSEWLEVVVRGSATSASLRFERGRLTGDAYHAAPLTRPGTRVTFRPDPAIFPEPVVSSEWVSNRMRMLSHLVPGVRFTVGTEATDTRAEHTNPGGLGALVEILNTGREVWHPPVTLSRRDPDLHIDAAIQFASRGSAEVLALANHYHTEEGGHHEAGLREGLVQGLNDTLTESCWRGSTGIPEGLNCGFCAIVSVRLPRPLWEGPWRQRLGSESVREPVAAAVRAAVGEAVRREPEEWKWLGWRSHLWSREQSP